MEKNTIDISKFDTTIKYPLFTILYAVDKSLNSSIKTYIVTGHKLNNNSNKRCFDTLLMSYPISIYVQQVEHTSIDNLKHTSLIDTNIEALKLQIVELIGNLKNEINLKLDKYK